MPHVLLIITAPFERQRSVDLQQKAPTLTIPWREHRQHCRLGAQSELRQYERCRSRHAKKIDKDSRAIQRVQINQDSQRAVGLQDLEHLARGGSLIDRAIAE